MPVDDLGFYRYQFLVYIIAMLSYLRVSISVLICACYICTADISISINNSQNKAILFMVLIWEFLVVLLYFKQASYDDSQVCIDM